MRSATSMMMTPAAMPGAVTRVIGEFVGEFVGEFASIARGLRGECSECVATIEGIATRGEGCSMPDDEEECWR